MGRLKKKSSRRSNKTIEGLKGWQTYKFQGLKSTQNVYSLVKSDTNLTAPALLLSWEMSTKGGKNGRTVVTYHYNHHVFCKPTLIHHAPSFSGTGAG